MMKRGWFGGGLWKPKNPHSLEHLRYLYAVLSKNQVVQESNRSLLVETLRSIAEILIWGDQNDSSVFDFFLEKNMLSFFLRIMKQKCGSYVCVQLLQTLNILFENIRNETSLYYLLSNNHVNSIIVHKFDFSDEEVMAYYISFLKTLSLKLNSHTIHFFYNEHTNDFPLYTEAIKFFNHPESMVRIAVRTLTLNVYKVDDQSMLQFIRDRTAAPYFSNLVWFIGNHILELDNCVRMDIDHSSRDRLADLVAEHLDHLHYLNDILKLNITELNHVLADHLLNRLLVPLLVYSLNRHHVQDDRPRVSRVVALFLLAQAFLIFAYSPLMQVLARIILHGDNSIFADCSPIVEGSIKLRPGFIAPEESLEQSLLSHSRAGSAYGSQDEYEVESQKSGYSEAGANFSEGDENQPFGCSGTNSQTLTYEESFTSYGDNTNSQIPSCDGSQPSGYKEDQLPGFEASAQSNNSIISGKHLKKKTKEFSSGENSSSPLLNSSGTLPHIPRLTEEISDELPQCEILMSLSGAGISELEATHVNITDEEKEQLKYCDIASYSPGQQPLKEITLAARPFLQSILEALNCAENDYSALFSLCLLYAIGHNTGINKELISSSLGKKDSESPRVYYNSQLIDCLLRIISHSAQYNSKIRVATLEMALNVLQHLIGLSDSFGPSVTNTHATAVSAHATATQSDINFNGGYLRDQHLAALEGAKEEATLLLRNFYKGEEIFLDMFEDEWRELHRRPLNVEYLLQDASILLPPAGTPLTGIDFNKRLPCGEVERARRSMRVFFLIRTLCLKIRGENDSHLPLTNPAACVQISDVLDLNNSDLIACVVITRDGQRTRRFLVIDIIQLILVEPDQRRLGWGVAKLVGFLQDLEVIGDKDDSRVLHITIHRPSAASFSVGRPATPLLAAKFIFDDHIRCMAAKQRLSKGRLKARQRKLHQIARLLEMPSHLQPCPSPPAHALSTMRQEARRGNRSGMESRSRSLVHKGKFNHSSRGPGVALKKEDDNSQSGSSDLSTSCSNTEPVNSQLGSFSRKTARSTSRPRPRSEEIPLENLSPPPSSSDGSKVILHENVISSEVPAMERLTNRNVPVCTTSSTISMESIIITGSAIPIYRVAEQVPFTSHNIYSNVKDFNVISPLCSLLPSGEMSVVPLCPVVPSIQSKKTPSKSPNVVPFTHIEIPDPGVDMKGKVTVNKVLTSKPNIQIANCSSAVHEKYVSNAGSNENCSDNKINDTEFVRNESTDPLESETSFSSKPICPKSSSFDFFEAQEPKTPIPTVLKQAKEDQNYRTANESLSEETVKDIACCSSDVAGKNSVASELSSSSILFSSIGDNEIKAKCQEIDSASGFSPIRKLKDSDKGKVEIV